MTHNELLSDSALVSLLDVTEVSVTASAYSDVEIKFKHQANANGTPNYIVSDDQLYIQLKLLDGTASQVNDFISDGGTLDFSLSEGDTSGISNIISLSVLNRFLQNILFSLSE